jgi:stromal interaction molecule 1
LNEVTQELQERVHRWKQIELLCGFNIINNSGLQYLESVLYRGTANGRGSVRGKFASLFMCLLQMNVLSWLEKIMEF